jgi:membrane-associated protein
MLNDLFEKFRDLDALVAWAGYIGCAAIIFAETGLLIGIFLPGDSLLFTAGLFAAEGKLNVWLLGALLNVAATAGNQSGYWIGRTTGPAIFKREDSRFFKKSYVTRAHNFYEKHGGKAIVLARFVPIVRTLAPVVAGVANMKYRTFLFFDIVGGILWVWSIVLLGYLLGVHVPAIRENLELAILIIIFLSITPAIYAWWKERGDRRASGNW